MADFNLVSDLRTLRYQSAWTHIMHSGAPTTWKTELQGLPLALRQQGLAPQLALMLGRGGKDLRIAEALGEWILDKHPGAPLLALPRRPDRSAARNLLAAAVTCEDPFALASATDEAIEFAAALKRLAV